MTIRKLFPYLSDEHRIILGRRFITSYINTHNSRPAKISEGEFMVYNYPMTFILKRMTRLTNAFKKSYPSADLRQGEKKQRNRIIVTAKKVN